MKKSSYLVVLALFSLVSCGQDVSSNKKKGSPNTVRDTSEATADQSVETIRSHIHREKGAPILSSSDEIKKSFTGGLAATYRKIPLMEKDNESASTTVTSLGRPTTTCGVGTFASINERIKDCISSNSNSSEWNGEKNGSAGESKWQLVMRSSDNKEIWLDSRTGMVWSDLIQTDTAKIFNWCKASGNTQANKGSVDCENIGEQVNLCDLADKLDGQIVWRLPTRNDFLQADINGLRFVLKKETDTGLWTATLKAGASNFSEAWLYSSKEGTLISGKLSEEHQLRCIGVPRR